MASLTIPEAIAENRHLKPGAKLLFAQMFALIKKGDRPQTGLAAFDVTMTLGGDDPIACIRSLAQEGYCRIDESVNRLEDVLGDQEVRLTCNVFIEVMPRIPMDADSITVRRYGNPEDPWDEVQIGRAVYRCTVGKLLHEFVLTLTKRDDESTTTLASNIPFTALKDAWEWFDAFISQEICGEAIPVEVVEKFIADRAADAAAAHELPDAEAPEPIQALYDWAVLQPCQWSPTFDNEWVRIFDAETYSRLAWEKTPGTEDIDVQTRATDENDGWLKMGGNRFERAALGARWPGLVVAEVEEETEAEGDANFPLELEDGTKIQVRTKALGRKSFDITFFGAGLADAVSVTEKATNGQHGGDIQGYSLKRAEKLRADYLKSQAGL